jgi:hypothetical protein
MKSTKSWDVVRSTPPARTPVQVSTPVRAKRTSTSRPSRKPSPQPIVATRTRTRPASSEPLKVRRARAKRLFYIGLGVFGTLIIGFLLYAAWLPSLRVTDVKVAGPDAESIRTIAESSLQGTHVFIVPRNSIFFLPESHMRKRILLEHPHIVAVSFKSAGLQGIEVLPVLRSSAFLWCGPSYGEKLQTCFSADADGYVFAPYQGTEPVASSTLLLKVYIPLEGDVLDPIRAHVGYASALPNSLRLAKSFRALGANISELAIRDDEADFYTLAGTRITYVIGREKEAAQLAASVFPQVKINDGTVEYVDLRFESKVYLRKGVPTVSEPKPVLNQSPEPEQESESL